jgi:hypothetical protein
MQLTKHFTLSELTHSQTADRLGLDNTPPGSVVINLTKTAHGLEMIRSLTQCPIVVSSGYRSPEVNKAVGSKTMLSQHITGHAADITCPAFGSPTKLMAAIHKQRAVIKYDQLLSEYAGKGGGWVHVSWTDKPRMQALVVDHDGTKVYTA